MINKPDAGHAEPAEPPPTVERVLINVWVEAYLRSLSPKRRMAFLADAAEIMQREASGLNVRDIRDPHAEALVDAKRAAHAIMTRDLNALMMRVR
jgi:hypothetical protein